MQMTEEQLKENLQKSYSRETWEKTLRFVFDHVSIYSSPTDIAHSSDKVQVFREIGAVQLHDGKKLALFELELKDKVNLLRNRVELNKLVSQYIDEDKAHGVLSIYEQGEEDYRFTFTAKGSEYNEETGEIVTKATDTKRFTYVLGKNESCRTAAHRFYELATKKETAEIDDVQEAFSVEKLSKQFFKEYKTHYDSFVDYLVGTTSYFKPIFKADDKSVRDFVKLLLGRIVFIQFLQKKRWMGVPADIDGWHNGDVNFLSKSFKEFGEQDLFYSQFLEPLYYEALNKADRPNHIFEPTGTKVPYLNGGLFEKHTVDTSLVNFPASYFEQLFDFFDKYNFTIDENDPEEHEVGIDPEMLGHIFENLLEDNKDKGAFYTPKEIVHYMCQESLKEYLKTYLINRDVWPRDEAKATELENGLARFVQHKEASSVIDHDAALSTALRDVKICDPAIGSGAFPMGLLNEIFRCVSTLHDISPDKVESVWGMEAWQPHIVKRNIIQNSIYGVDIEKGAVDIARLRFWLSLITDEPEPTSLPNLDYKIVVGNSLLSKFEDEVITIDWDKKNSAGKGLFYLQELQTALQDISTKQKEYFNPDAKNRSKLALEIRNLKLKVLKNQLSLDRESYINKTAEKGGFAPTERDKKHNAERKSQILTFDVTLRKVENLIAHSEKPFNHFDWKLDFPEVMNEQVATNVGFDIVIGNPPYVSAVTMARDDETKKYFKEKYPLATGSYDLYLLFILKAINLSNSSGTYTWIIPNKFLIADYAKNSRFNLIKLHGLSYSLNVSKFNVFEGIGVYPIIIFGNKNSQKEFEELLLERYEDLERRIFVAPTSLKNHKTIKEYGLRINAGATGFQAKQLKGIVSNKVKKGSIPFTVSGNIDRYKWTNESVRYMGERYPTAFINNSTKIVADSKWTFWTQPKIVIAGMTKVIEAVYVDNSLGMGVGIYGIYDFKGFDPNCLTAILNSKYLTYYFQIKFKDKHLAGGYLAINKSTIEEFPLVNISKANQKKLSDLSKKAHKLSEQNKSIEMIEQEIDNLVYRLYELTYDEVKVIAPDFSLSIEEYEAIEI